MCPESFLLANLYLQLFMDMKIQVIWKTQRKISGETLHETEPLTVARSMGGDQKLYFSE